MKRSHSFFYRNGLTLVLIALFLLSIVGQILTGLNEFNDELQEYHKAPITILPYLRTGHFIQSTFENWESEFLQMSLYVLLTVWLRQQGSSESKDLDSKEEVDRPADPFREGAPWPVKRGGIVLKLYKNSLSFAFVALFLTSYFLHAAGSLKNYNFEQSLKGLPAVEMSEFMTKSRFWFESFQNWQSEFVAVISIVVLSIFLRQQGSPESKPVDAPVHETGA